MNKQQIKIFSDTSLYQVQENVNSWLNKCTDIIVEECNFSKGVLVVLYHLDSDNPKYSGITSQLHSIASRLMDMNY